MLILFGYLKFQNFELKFLSDYLKLSKTDEIYLCEYKKEFFISVKEIINLLILSVKASNQVDFILKHFQFDNVNTYIN